MALVGTALLVPEIKAASGKMLASRIAPNAGRPMPRRKRLICHHFEIFR